MNELPQSLALIGSSPNFLKALDTARRVAPSKASIFISGESGTGKELFARFIHNESQQAKGPFIVINCSAIPEGLLESELFGHVKGSYTGATANKRGLFEEAQDGTLFLDEIGDLSLSLQAKLLRVLQEKQVKRVGENHHRPINCRIISATHKDLPREVYQNRFREDLFFRLIVIPITIPPLRERKEDLLPLANFFLRKFADENNSSAIGFSEESIAFILANPWRGNVRELENTVERAVILANGPTISLSGFKSLLPVPAIEPNNSLTPSSDRVFQVQCSEQLMSLADVTRSYIEFAVRQNHGARDKTAREIGIDRKTLYKRIPLNH
jgi:transcriptional regulator with PAS, ATPase and Fis domain